ncbi:hypothetical protein SAY87_031982 [Trapa incisa]|uniref:Uncharacterized protein n=1 Tax=Trapa incisa TaxID=236973 RepID=A0AAN7KR41_9MYRT|nr:hypothetical protein SAY87_031982 [Trapa incisa]
MDYMPLSLIILGLCLSWWLLRPIILYYLAVSKRADNNKSSSTSGKLPPGPRPLPVIGNILELGSLPHMSLTKLARVYGPIIRLKLGHITTIVVSSAPMAREILQTHDDSFANRMPPDAITPFRHDELGVAWVTISPLWRNLRRICNVHLFARRTPISISAARKSSKSCETGNPVDIGEAAFIAALNLLGNTIFSMDLTMDAASELSVKELKELVCNVMVQVGRPNMADYFPVLKRVDPQGVKRRMTDCFQRTFDLFDRIIGERLRVRSSAVSGASSYSRRKVNDMLDILLDLAEDKGEEGGIDLYTVKHLFFVG